MNNTHKIIRLFKDTHMSRQHAGLTEVAKSQDIDTRKLKFGEHVAFVNSKWSKGKLYSANNIINYIVPLNGERFTDNFFEQIVHCFDKNGKLDIKKADRVSIMAKIKKQAPQLLQGKQYKKINIKSLPKSKGVSPLTAYRIKKNASQKVDDVKKIT